MVLVTNKGLAVDLKITKNEFSATNNKLKIDPTTYAVSAWSYDWWKYMATDSVGNVIFLNSKYSNTTSRHQSSARSILERLNIKIDLTLHHTLKSLDGYDGRWGKGAPAGKGIEYAIRDEIKEIQEIIANLADEMKKRGSHKRKNEERQKQIKNHEYRIKDLERFISQSLNKVKLKTTVDRTDRQYAFLESQLAHLFLKPNGAIQRNELREYIKYNRIVLTTNWETVGDEVVEDYLREENNRRLKANFQNTLSVFSLKRVNIREILTYVFCKDLENMIGSEGSADFADVQKKIKSLNLVGKSDPLSLDKIHTYIINRNNRRLRGPVEPREEIKFPYPQWLYQLAEQDKDMKDHALILDSARKLRLEGKRQSHCIGGENYIRQCQRDHFALNYKGYTFFFSHSGQLSQASGKYNAPVPQSIEQELMNKFTATNERLRA